MDLFDVIETLVEVPELGLGPGARGTIVIVYPEPDPAYEVEFNEQWLPEPDTAVLLPHQVRLVWTPSRGDVR